MPQPSEFRRAAIRAALQIHDHLSGARAHAISVDPPEQTWREVCRTLSRLQLTSKRNWRAATERLVDDLDYNLRTLDRELSALRQQMSQPPRSHEVTLPRDILADLEAIKREFQDVTVDLDEQTISVLTEPIELEGMWLGPFRIVLRWDRIGLPPAYEVIATEPCAAEGDSDVTHPHVREQSLCEGDGAAPIRAALAQGRLLDFFTLVHQILQTYNAESPHVPLDRWDGVSCRDCGWRMPSDDYGVCERCEAPVCADCTTSCQGCDRFVCASCTGECTACGAYVCQGCLAMPADSKRQLCPTCLETYREENDDPQENDPEIDPAGQPLVGVDLPDSSAAALHPLCLDEAAIPA